MKHIISLAITAAALLTPASALRAVQIPEAVLDSVAAVQTENPAPQMESATAVYGPDIMWEEANSAYMNGQFSEAAALYEQILGEGLFSAKLYYNLANAYFRSGANAKAILYYNRALRLAPNDDDIRHNLAIAESLTKDSIDEVPEFFLNTLMRKMRNSLDERTWTTLSLLLFAAALALGLMFLLATATPLRKGGFYGMAAALLLFAIATSFAIAQRNAQLDRKEAIVMSTAAPVKSSPDRSATDLFVLHEGTAVRVVGTLDRWSEVVIADGKKGWMESDKIELI